MALGIPWEKSKDLPFAFSTTYIGLQWDLTSLSVSLSHEKRLKYTLSIQEWFLHPTHTLNNVQKLYGKLLHACLVIPAGWAFLTGLEAMLRLCNQQPFAHFSAAKGVSDNLAWWLSKLASFISRPIPAPLHLLDPHAFSLASALPSPSNTNGELGTSSWVGKIWMVSETLDGRKPLA